MRFAILPAGAACGIWSPAGRQPLAQHAAATQVGVGVAEAPSGGMLGNGKKQTGAPSAAATRVGVAEAPSGRQNALLLNKRVIHDATPNQDLRLTDL